MNSDGKHDRGFDRDAVRVAPSTMQSEPHRQSIEVIVDQRVVLRRPFEGIAHSGK